MGTAWRKAMQHRVTLLRNATSRSSSGSTKFNYSTVATGLICSVQDAGGRQVQADEGQEPKRKKSVLFGEENINVVQQNDVIVLENGTVGERYKLVHVHVVIDANAPHVECQAEQELQPGQV